jgi:crotonobetainyl-CoA:carnitine CoA-transferase CaiB-like acyl-CoA transferase
MGWALYYTAYQGTSLPRTGAEHSILVPYGPFDTRDGPVCLGIQNEREWARFCTDVLRQPALANDERFRSNPLRVQHRQEVRELIEKVFSELSESEVLDRLEAAQIAYAKMNTVGEFLRHPQLTTRGCWRQIDSSVGALNVMIPPVRMEDVEPIMGKLPELGEHSRGILRELGFDEPSIDRWAGDGLF